MPPIDRFDRSRFFDSSSFPDASHLRDSISLPPQSFETPKIADEAFSEVGNEANGVSLSDGAGTVSGGQRVSSWLLSVALHVALTIVLALIFFPGPPSPPEIEAIFSDSLGDQLDFLTEDEGSLNPNFAEKYELTVPEEYQIEDIIVQEHPNLEFVPDVAAPFSDPSRIEPTEAFAGRTDPGTKNDLLAKYGGNQTTQDAVEAGLRWLARQQQKNGSWSLKGPYSNGVSQVIPENDVAATALALLAFQGAGETQTSGEHALVVRRGWNWLLKQQRQDGCFTPVGATSESLFYTHAICTIGLCELIALEKKPNDSLRRQARRALDYLIENQNKELGGWRYAPGVGSDLSVTGWCLMALQSARSAEFEIPESTFGKISQFLDSVSYDDGAAYAYQLDAAGNLSERRPSMTATGLLCREYLGWAQDAPALLRGADAISSEENLICFPTTQEEEKDFYCNVYGWYSTSMALKHLGPYNKYWRRWNAAMSRELPKRQEPKGSKEAGSWNPQFDEYSFGGGRLYVTCLSILCLEVYYRHLSVYR